MKITKVFDPPCVDGLYSGYAESTRGRRYYWCAHDTGKLACVERQELVELDGLTLWLCVGRGPRGLSAPVQRAVKRARAAA